MDGESAPLATRHSKMIAKSPKANSSTISQSLSQRSILMVQKL